MTLKLRSWSRQSLLLLLLFALAACGGAASETPSAVATSVREESAWNLEKKRAWAAKLRSEGLDDRAIEAYESLLSDPGVSPALVTGVSITVAEMHVAKGRYEKALASVLRANLYQLPAERRRKADQMAILCLERLGRSGAADRLLDRATGLDKAKSTDSDVVVAKVGEESIRRSELESFIAMTPEEGREKLNSAEGKLEVLKSLVAQKVITRKARKLGYDEDPTVQLALELAHRDILVKKVVAEEIRARVEKTGGDQDAIKLFYQAHPEIFRTPGQLTVAHVLVSNQSEADKLRSRLRAGEDFDALAKELSQDPATSHRGGRIDEVLIEGRAHKTFARPQDVFAACAGTKNGDVAAEDVVTAKGRHIVKILESEAGRPVPFEECREEVERIYRGDRERKAMQSLFDETLKEADVEIFEDRLK